MTRHTLFSTAIGAVALAAVLLLLAPALPVSAAGGPYALQSPETFPPTMADGHHAASQSAMPAETGSMMEHHGMMTGTSEMRSDAQANQARLEDLVARLEATSGDAQMAVMVELLETLVADHGLLLEAGMGGMHPSHGVGGMQGMHGPSGAAGPMGHQSMTNGMSTSGSPCPMAPAAGVPPSSEKEGATE